MKKCPRCGHNALEQYENADPMSEIQLSVCKRCGFKKMDQVSSGSEK